jgi:DNA-binding SARP family transcriptional activator
MELLEPHGLNPSERDLAVLLGGYVIIWFLWRGDTARARGVIERIEPWIGADRAPMVAILWSCAVALYHSVQGRIDDCRLAVQAGLSLAERSGLQAFDFLLAAQMARCCLVAGDVDQAETWMGVMARTMRGHGYINGAFYWHLHSNAAAQRGNWQQAAEHARGGLAMALDSGVPYLEAHCRIDLARALIGGSVGADEDTAGWAGHLDAAQAIGGAMGSRVIEYLCLDARATAAFRHRDGNEARGLASLREALRLSRAMDGAIWMMAGQNANAPLFDRALSAGIEVEHVQRLIRRHGIMPPEPATAAENWPWPVRIYTLGRFDVLRDDEPLLRSSGKVQLKPLELLKCLCALGGRAVAQDSVTDALWPDAEGDAADQALRTTLHRLRKLLQSDRAVRLEDRQLHLDPHIVWVDCLAFDRVARQPLLADRDGLRRALDAYRGVFLQGESATWTIAFREQLRAQHLRMAERLGALLEDEGDCTGAIGCWLRAIEVEPLAEGLYRRLMQAYARIDRRAEALAVYQRCRLAMLSRLGVSPTAETQALHRSMKDAG